MYTIPSQEYRWYQVLGKNIIPALIFTCTSVQGKEEEVTEGQ